VDYAGVALLTAGLTALVLALVEGNSWGWGSIEIVGLLIGAVVALTAFVAVELRVRVPMIEFRFFSDRNFLGAVVVALIVSFAMLGVFFFLALYMQDILGYSPLEAGVRFLPSTLMIVTVAPIAGRVSDRIGSRWLIVLGLLVVAASLYSFSGMAVDSSYASLLPGFMMLGVGIALTMSPMTSAAMNAVAVEKAGIASGVLSMFRMVGGSLGVAVTGAIFQGLIRSQLDTQLAGTGVSAAQRTELVHRFGAGSAEGLHGLAPAQARQAVAAGRESFVYALSHAMEVSAGVALFGALVAALAIRARRHPGEEQLASEERVVEAPEPVVGPATTVDPG
jgi:predicted MFS family arabinose efflux permease